MSATSDDDAPPYHLFLDVDEVPVAASALRLLISDEAHEPGIRALAREAIELVGAAPAGAGPAAGSAGAEEPAEAASSAGAAPLTVPLTAPQMKIVHTAVKLLLLDTQRGQESERQLLHAILDKLPDEHALRAITLE